MEYISQELSQSEGVIQESKRCAMIEVSVSPWRVSLEVEYCAHSGKGMACAGTVESDRWFDQATHGLGQGEE